MTDRMGYIIYSGNREESVSKLVRSQFQVCMRGVNPVAVDSMSHPWVGLGRAGGLAPISHCSQFVS